jgi:flagellar biosynthesis/type III secretory pathway M-ring protein FliF/YscJ
LPQILTETANSIAVFVGIAVTLAIVLIVLFVILIICKRRRQASESPTSVDRVGIENQAVEAETESPPTNNQVSSHNIELFSS